MRTKLLFFFFLLMLLQVNMSTSAMVLKDAHRIMLKDIKASGSHRSMPVLPTAFIDGSLLSVDFLSAVTSAAVTVRNSATGEIVYSSVEMNVTTLRIDLTGKSAGEYSLEIGIGDTILSGDFLLEYEFKPNESPYRNSGDIVIRDPKNVLQDMMMEKVSCSACTKLYKSDFLTSLQFPEGKNYEDRLVMYEWVALCKKVVWVDSPFYHYVERQTSICHTMSPMNLYHYFLAEYARMRFMEKYSLFEEEDLFKIRTRLIGTCLTIFKEILLKVNLREFKEPVKDMRQKMKEIAALPEGTYELKYRRRARKIAYHWHLYYLTHFLLKKGGDS